MKKIFLVLLSVIVISALVLGACASPAPEPEPSPAPAPAPAPAPEPSPEPTPTPIKLIASNPAPLTHFNVAQYDKMLTEIEEASNGRVQIERFYGGAILAYGATFDGLLDGVADIGNDQLSLNKGRFLVNEIIELPWGYPNALIANRVAWDVFNKFQPAELNDFHIISNSAMGNCALDSNKLVLTLDDLKGMKIRGTGNMAKMVEALGGVPISMPIYETYDALSKGTVEAALAGADCLEAWKFAEVVKYAVNFSPVGPTMTSPVLMSLDKWNSLPPEVQQVFDEVGERNITEFGEVWETAINSAWNFAREHDVEIITISPEEQVIWKSKMEPLIDAFLAEVDAKGKGIPTSEIKNFIQESIKKYSDQYNID